MLLISNALLDGRYFKGDTSLAIAWCFYSVICFRQWCSGKDSPEHIEDEKITQEVFSNKDFLRNLVTTLSGVNDESLDIVFVGKEFGTPHGKIDVLAVDSLGGFTLLRLSCTGTPIYAR